MKLFERVQIPEQYQDDPTKYIELKDGKLKNVRPSLGELYGKLRDIAKIPQQNEQVTEVRAELEVAESAFERRVTTVSSKIAAKLDRANPQTKLLRLKERWLNSGFAQLLARDPKEDLIKITSPGDVETFPTEAEVSREEKLDAVREKIGTLSKVENDSRPVEDEQLQIFRQLEAIDAAAKREREKRIELAKVLCEVFDNDPKYKTYLREHVGNTLGIGNLSSGTPLDSLISADQWAALDLSVILRAIEKPEFKKKLLEAETKVRGVVGVHGSIATVKKYNLAPGLLEKRTEADKKEVLSRFLGNSAGIHAGQHVRALPKYNYSVPLTSSDYLRPGEINTPQEAATTQEKDSENWVAARPGGKAFSPGELEALDGLRPLGLNISRVTGRPAIRSLPGDSNQQA